MSEKDPFLRECPCCGGDARIVEIEGPIEVGMVFPDYIVICKKCGLQTSLRETKQKAVDAWNTRIEKGSKE